MCTRKVSRVHNDLTEVIRKVAEVKKITDIQYNVIFGNEDVDLFASGFYTVVLNGKMNGYYVRHKVIIKWHHSVEDRVHFRAAYRREYTIFNVVIPMFLKIQRKLVNNEGLKFKFPNCIFSSMEYNKEVIVVHYDNHYKIFNRFHKIDFAHVSLVIKNLAKLHALSFASAKIYPDKFEEIKTLLSEDVQYSDTKKISKSLICYFNASLSVISDEKFREKLEIIGPNIAFILHKYSSPFSKYNVICHADCWHNNILFKYQGARPVDTIFIDYQLARFASPVTDISYFLYMSTDYDFLSKYYEQLLEIYYGTCSGFLRECNIDIAEIYPRHVFHEQMYEHSVFGLVEALISMKIITAESEEAQKMTEMKHQADDVNINDYEIQNQDIFKGRVNGIVNFFFQKRNSSDSLLIDAQN